MAVQMTELDHIPGEELTHIPGEELTHIPGEELTHEPGLPLGYAPKWLLDELGLGHYYDPALTVDLNPLPPTVPHAPKTLPDPPPKKSQLPVPIVEHPNVKSQLPVPIEEPLAVASHLPVSLPEPAAKKSQLPVAMPGVEGTEAERRAVGRAQPPPAVFWSTPSEPTSLADVIARRTPPYSPPYVSVSPQESSEFFGNPGMGFQRTTSVMLEDGLEPITIDDQEVASHSAYIRLFWSGLVDSRGSLKPMDDVFERLLRTARQKDLRLSIRVMPFDTLAKPPNMPPTPLETLLYGRAATPAIHLPPSEWANSVGYNPKWPSSQAGAILDVPNINEAFLGKATELIHRLRSLVVNDLDRIDFIDVGLVGTSGEWASGDVLQWGAPNLATPKRIVPDRSQQQILEEIARTFRTTFPDVYLILNVMSVLPPGPSGDIGVLAGSVLSSSAPAQLPASIGWRTDHWGTEWKSDADVNPPNSPAPRAATTFGNDVYLTSLLNKMNEAHPHSPVVLEVGSTVNKPLQQDLPSLIEVNSPSMPAPLDEMLDWSIAQALNARASFIYLKRYNLLQPLAFWSSAQAPTGQLTHVVDPATHDRCRLALLQFAQRVGYRLVVQNVRLRSTLRAEQPFPFHMRVANRGVAPCYGAGPGRPYEFILRFTPVSHPSPVHIVPTGLQADTIPPSEQPLVDNGQGTHAHVYSQSFPANGTQVTAGPFVVAPSWSHDVLLMAPSRGGTYAVELGLAARTARGKWSASVRLANYECIRQQDGTWWMKLAEVVIT